MKAKISELMDGELHEPEAAGPLSALREEGEARDAWRIYHLISDSMRDTRVLSRRFAEQMMQRLAEEPTVLAPAVPAEVVAGRGRRFLLQAAAAVASVAAAIVVVGSLWIGPQTPEQLPVPMAQTVVPRPVAPAEVAVSGTTPARQASRAAVMEPVHVPLPVATDDYLLAHQGYATRNLLQGVAPYVRTVSEQAAARTR